MCEIVDPSTLRSSRVECAAVIKIKNDRENCKIGYEEQIEGSYPGGKLQRGRGPSKSIDPIHSQVRVEETPKKTQE